MKKKILLWLVTIIIIISLPGCKTKKEEVKLKSEKDIVKYASQKYGKTNYINKQVESDSIKYTLQDNEYKFNYECSSYVSKVCIDASCAELYYETTTCDFDNNYKKYVLEKLDLDNIYKNFYQNNPVNTGAKEYLFALNCENEEKAKQNVEKVAIRLKKIDTRQYFSDYYIAIYDNNNEYLGIYNIANNKYINRYDAAIEAMTHAFATQVNNNSGDLNGIKYLYYKRIQYKDVEKLQMEWLHKKDLKPEDWTTAYYFEYYGKTYFMLDEKVFITDKNIFNQYISDKYYTSYWFDNN